MLAQDSVHDLDVSQSDADSDLWGSEATTSQGEQGERYEEHAIARAETKAVRSLKLLVYLVLVVSAVAVSVGAS